MWGGVSLDLYCCVRLFELGSVRLNPQSLHWLFLDVRINDGIGVIWTWFWTCGCVVLGRRLTNDTDYEWIFNLSTYTDWIMLFPYLHSLAGDAFIFAHQRWCMCMLEQSIWLVEQEPDTGRSPGYNVRVLAQNRVFLNESWREGNTYKGKVEHECRDPHCAELWTCTLRLSSSLSLSLTLQRCLQPLPWWPSKRYTPLLSAVASFIVSC